MNNWQMGITWGLVLVNYLRTYGLTKRVKAEAKTIRQHVSRALADHRKLTLNSTYGKAGNND